MPELPEVETVKESLKKIILNKKISNIEVFYDRIIQNISVKEFIEELTDEEFIDINEYMLALVEKTNKKDNN